MRSFSTPLLLSLVFLSSTTALTVAQDTIVQPSPETAQQTFAIDNAHTSAQFKVEHLRISWVHGRFNEVAGEFKLDGKQRLTSIGLTIQVKSLDTKNEQRDTHLRSADFFDAEQFPSIVFESTAIRPSDKGLTVTGNVEMHGVTRQLIFELVGGKSAEFPEGVHRVGYSTAFVLKRSDFGMKTMLGPVGDKVHAEVSFEGIKQK